MKATNQQIAYAYAIGLILLIVVIIGFFSGWWGKFSYSNLMAGNRTMLATGTRQYRMGGSVGVGGRGSSPFLSGTDLGVNAGITTETPIITGRTIVNPANTVYTSCESIVARINFIKSNYYGSASGYMAELESLKFQYNKMNCNGSAMAKKTGGAACEAWLYCPSGCHQLWTACFGA